MSALRTADFQERRRARQAIVTKRVQMINSAIDYLDALDEAMERAELLAPDRIALTRTLHNTYKALERAREAVQ